MKRILNKRWKRIVSLLVAMALLIGVVPWGTLKVQAETTETLTISVDQTNSSAKTLYLKANADPTKIGSWADIRNYCNEEDYILINDAKVANWSSLELRATGDGWTNHFYINNLGATEGTTVIIKTGFTIVIGGINYTTENDYKFRFDGSKWYVNETFTINNLHTASNSTIIYFETNVNYGATETNIKAKANEEDFVLLNNEKIEDWTTLNFKSAAWNKAYYIQNFKAVEGTILTVKKGFTVTSTSNISYTTEQDYIYYFDGSKWYQLDTLQITGIHSASKAETIYINTNADPSKAGSWVDIRNYCNEEDYILINDAKVADWSSLELRATGDGWTNHFYINCLNANEGTKLSIKKGFALNISGARYITDKDYRFGFDGSKWSFLYTVDVTGGSADQTIATANSEVTLTVDVDAIEDCKVFDYWLVNGEKIDGNTFTLTEDATVEAVYKWSDTLTSDANGDGYADVRDVIRFKRYLKDSTISIHPYSADVISPSGVDQDDLDESYEYLLNKYCLSTFAKDAYKQNVGNGWLSARPYQSVEILSADTDVKNNVENGVLKFTYGTSFNEFSPMVQLAREVNVNDIYSLDVTVRLEGNVRTPDNNRNIIFYSSNAGRDGLYTSGAKTQNAIVGADYATISITNRDLLNQMADSDGYIRKIQMELFSNQKAELYLYIADISYTPVTYSVSVEGGSADVTNGEKGSTVTLTASAGRLADGEELLYWNVNGTKIEGNTFTLMQDTTVEGVYELPEYCLSTFSDSSYLNYFKDGWVQGSGYTKEILQQDAGQTGVLKVTYPATNGESSGLIQLEKPVKATDVTSLDITFRLSGDYKQMTSGSLKYTAIISKANESPYEAVNGGFLVDANTTYQTAKVVGENVLQAYADDDGYIRQIQIETYGNKADSRCLYIADISYTMYDNFPSYGTGEMELGIFSSPAPTQAAYQECADAGFTYVLIDQNNGAFDLETYRSTLQYCAEAGMKSIPMKLGVEADTFNNTDYSQVPGFAGKFYWDEPALSDMDTIAGWAEIFEQQNGTEKLFYNNLYPCYASSSVIGNDYRHYLDAYIDTVLSKVNGKKLLSVDFYPLQRTTEKKFSWSELKYVYNTYNSIRTDYLYNLEATAQAALDKGVDVSYFVQTHGHGTTDTVNRDLTSVADMRFQYNTAMAYGVKSFAAFTYPSQGGGEFENYQGLVKNTYNDSTGWTTEKTPVYGYVKQANEELKAWDEVYLSFDYVGTKALLGSSSSSNACFKKLTQNKEAITGLTSITATQDTLIGEFDKDGVTAYMISNFTEPSEKLSDTVELELSEATRVQVYINGVKETKIVPKGKLTITLGAGEAAFVVLGK